MADPRYPYNPDDWMSTLPMPGEAPPEVPTIPLEQAPPQQTPQGYVSQIDPFGLANAYEGAPSYIPLGNVPQPQMPTQLQSFLSGEGYDPATMAAMRAGTIEDISNAALPQLGATRRALGQAGLTNSPAGQAYLANIGRQTGDKQASGLQQLNVSNAMLGMENKKFGLNMAHQWAMENANRLFEAMNQNLSQSGANTRTGAQIAFNEQPFQPSGGQPQQSRFGPAVTGAANALGEWGTQQQVNKVPEMPINRLPNQMEIPGLTSEPGMQMGGDQAFQKNPFKGY